MFTRRWLFVACYSASGAAALVYQVVWVRLFTLAFGHTVASSSIVLGAFMCGLALGAWAAGRMKLSPSRLSPFTPCSNYLIAAAAIALPAALSLFQPLLRGHTPTARPRSVLARSRCHLLHVAWVSCRCDGRHISLLLSHGLSANRKRRTLRRRRERCRGGHPICGKHGRRCDRRARRRLLAHPVLWPSRASFHRAADLDTRNFEAMRGGVIAATGTGRITEETRWLRSERQKNRRTPLFRQRYLTCSRSPATWKVRSPRRSTANKAAPDSPQPLEQLASVFADLGEPRLAAVAETLVEPISDARREPLLSGHRPLPAATA